MPTALECRIHTPLLHLSPIVRMAPQSDLLGEQSAINDVAAVVLLDNEQSDLQARYDVWVTSDEIEIAKDLVQSLPTMPVPTRYVFLFFWSAF